MDGLQVVVHPLSRTSSIISRSTNQSYHAQHSNPIILSARSRKVGTHLLCIETVSAFQGLHVLVRRLRQSRNVAWQSVIGETSFASESWLGNEVSVSTTVVAERWLSSDVAVTVSAAAEEVIALARAATRAARDAVAYAEAQVLAEAFENFPTEKDLLLLERARLSEMERAGAVHGEEQIQVVTGAGRGSILDPLQGLTCVPKDMEEESGSGRPMLRSCLETSFLDEMEYDGFTSGELNNTVTVRSSRRHERLMKRERAICKAEKAAAAVVLRSTKPKKIHHVYDLNDPFRSYLRDMGKSKLLTAAEEVELSQGIQDLLKMESLRDSLAEQIGREPTVVEWAQAAGLEKHKIESRLKSGKICKDRMVNCNLRLVVSIAKKYQGRGMAIQDLIQEGSMGLIRGAEKFDHTRGFKFSTYAHWWIRQAITRAIADQSRTIRLPVHIYELLSRINKARNMLETEHGRAARDDEIAELVGLSIQKLKMVLKSVKSPKSMEYPLGRNNDTTLGEVIADSSRETAEDEISKRLLKQDLDTVLHTLSSRERDVLRLRYGLDDGRMRTLEEIGVVFRVTRERIRQIEAKALRKLRQPSRNTTLRGYLDL